MTTRNILEFNILNEKIRKFLIEEGVIDQGDGEIYAKTIIYTRDSLQNFKENCENYSDHERINFEGKKIQILRNFQFKKGDVRKSLFFLENNDGGQNLVIIY